MKFYLYILFILSKIQNNYNHNKNNLKKKQSTIQLNHKLNDKIYYVQKYFIGNYSRLACEIQFVRSMGYYLIQIYIPSGLIVIISWVSFWLNRNATPARVALGVTTVLTMTTLMSSTNAALPKISYVKSIDVYLGTCFVMVFASLLGKQENNHNSKSIQFHLFFYVFSSKINCWLIEIFEDETKKKQIRDYTLTESYISCFVRFSICVQLIIFI